MAGKVAKGSAETECNPHNRVAKETVMRLVVKSARSAVPYMQSTPIPSDRPSKPAACPKCGRRERYRLAQVHCSGAKESNVQSGRWGAVAGQPTTWLVAPAALRWRRLPPCCNLGVACRGPGALPPTPGYLARPCSAGRALFRLPRATSPRPAPRAGQAGQGPGRAGRAGRLRSDNPRMLR
jgi:hypothetical protein